MAVVSDFRDQEDWARPLAAVAGRHSAVAVEIHDPRESALPRSAGSRWSTPRPAQRLEVDTSSSRVRQRFEELERERRDALASELRRLQVTHVALDTDGDWLLELAAGLSFKQKARARR